MRWIYICSIIVVTMIFVGLLSVINLQNKRIDAANNYIEVLENTYPDYIGTVANTQAFIKWYSLESCFD